MGRLGSDYEILITSQSGGNFHILYLQVRQKPCLYFSMNVILSDCKQRRIPPRSGGDPHLHCTERSEVHVSFHSG